MTPFESDLAAKRKRAAPIARKYDDVNRRLMETGHTSIASSEHVAAARRLSLHSEAVSEFHCDERITV